MRRILLLVSLLALLAGTAYGAGPKEPRCATKNPDPPRMIQTGGEAFLLGEFRNRCLDPVTEMGSFACLLEYEYGDAQNARYVSCHSNRDRPVLFAPHETNLFLTAKCDYTSIARVYQVTGYGWAVSVTGTEYQSQKQVSTKWFGGVGSSAGARHYCHIAKLNVEWRDRRS